MGRTAPEEHIARLFHQLDLHMRGPNKMWQNCMYMSCLMGLHQGVCMGLLGQDKDSDAGLHCMWSFK